MHVVIYSGGLDSYTLLRKVMDDVGRRDQKDPTKNVIALSFNYGQRHAKELGVARDVCAELLIPHHVIDLKEVGALLGGSSLTDRSIDTPHGHYEEESMKKTVVPGRNTIMLSVAMGFAEALPFYGDNVHTHNMHFVYYGAHAGDHHIYPDCRPTYIAAVQDVFVEATEHKVYLRAPFQKHSKGQIVAVGLALASEGVQIDYSKTWTCYEGEDEPCGKCGACTERAQAFAANGVDDPLLIKKGL